MTARISITGSRAAYVGPGLALAPHRNGAATLAVAQGPPFSLALADSSGRLRPPALHRLASIPPGVRHHLVADGPMLFLYLDALSDDHRRLAAGDPGNRSEAVLAAAEAGGDADALAAALGLPPPAGDPLLAPVIARLAAAPQDFPHVGTAARLAGLSPSRFQARFRVAMGLPFRRFRQWRRLAVALAAVADGASLTEAALTAGFAGSAHFSTAFRAMVGMAPSRLLATGVRVAVSPPG